MAEIWALCSAFLTHFPPDAPQITQLQSPQNKGPWLLPVTKQTKLVVHFFYRFPHTEAVEKRPGAE